MHVKVPTSDSSNDGIFELYFDNVRILSGTDPLAIARAIEINEPFAVGLDLSTTYAANTYGYFRLDFLLFDPDNPSSVRTCIRAARTNARTVRTSITRDMWEAMNTTYLAFEAIKPDEITDARLPEFLDWVRERTSHFRGALLNTILRNDTYYFSQIGGFSRHSLVP